MSFEVQQKASPRRANIRGNSGILTYLRLFRNESRLKIFLLTITRMKENLERFNFFFQIWFFILILLVNDPRVQFSGVMCKDDKYTQPECISRSAPIGHHPSAATGTLPLALRSRVSSVFVLCPTTLRMVKRGGERRVDDEFSRSFEFHFPRSRQFGPGSFRLRAQRLRKRRSGAHAFDG